LFDALIAADKNATFNGWHFLLSARCRFAGIDAVLSSIRLGLPGAARQPLTFFASPKKVSKERRPQESLPAARVPKSSDSQSASQTNSLRSNMFAPLYPPDYRLPWQRQMRERQKQQPCDFTLVRRRSTTKRLWLLSALTLPFVRGRKWKKKWTLSERSEFRPLPIFCLAQTGTPQGLRLRGRLLLLTFLGETRKVSGCRATPGNPSLIEESTALTPVN